MAALTNKDFTAFKHEIRKRPAAKAAMRTLAPSKATWMAVMQALEDGYNSRRPALKAEMDVAAGGAIPLALAKELEDIWMDWRGRRR